MRSWNSIRRVGLKKYLNSTKEQHNDFSYEAFYNMVNVPRPPTVASMARIFGVSKHTMHKWLEIFKEEQEGEL